MVMVLEEGVQYGCESYVNLYGFLLSGRIGLRWGRRKRMVFDGAGIEGFFVIAVVVVV